VLYTTKLKGLLSRTDIVIPACQHSPFYIGFNSPNVCLQNGPTSDPKCTGYVRQS